MKQFLQVTVGMALLALCGCSTFSYEWRREARRTAPANGITGPWEGRWLSQSNGHAGTLRAIVTQVDTSHLDVKFYAAYKQWITFHFGYTVRMEAKPGVEGVVSFRGSEDLGALAGGVYNYEGQADRTNFSSTYKSKYDHGTFEMKRPVAGK